MGRSSYLFSYNSWALLVILWAHLITNSKGLQCYTCAHADVGKFDAEYELDESCKWGRKPDEKYLKTCVVDEGEDEKNYDFACVEFRVNGSYLDETRGNIFGTMRGCTARRLPNANAASGQQQSSYIKGSVVERPFAYRGCIQGSLAGLANIMLTPPTPREFLRGMLTLFNDKNGVKFCYCDVDACWEEQKEEEGDGEKEDEDDNGGGPGQNGNGSSFIGPIKYFLIIGASVLYLNNQMY